MCYNTVVNVLNVLVSLALRDSRRDQDPETRRRERESTTPAQQGKHCHRAEPLRSTIMPTPDYYQFLSAKPLPTVPLEYPAPAHAHGHCVSQTHINGGDELVVSYIRTKRKQN